MSAHDDFKTAQMKLAHRCNLAEALAPSFRDKFDFSEPKHFDAWADMAVMAADALIRKQEALFAEEKKRHEEAVLAENNAKKLADLTLSKASQTGQEAKS